MKKTYYIKGMTCTGCVRTVTRLLEGVAGINTVEVSLERGEAILSMDKPTATLDLERALPQKYQLFEERKETEKTKHFDDVSDTDKTKLQQLRPLILILFYISVASILIHRNDLNTKSIMLDFMGLFYVVFSFFKLLDLKGFPASFGMYDPLAQRFPVYGKIYPFIEAALGLMFLMRFQLEIALITTLLILGITTIGVTGSLLDKKTIRCACLGTALKLPMTEATFIENAIMIIMAFIMLLKLV